MIRITREQWDCMGRESFQSRLVTLIRHHHAAQAARHTDSQLRAGMPGQVVRAHRYGLFDEQAVATFVYAAWLLGHRFDERIPALAQILNEPGLSSGTKADALVNFSILVFHALEKGPQARTPRP